MAASLLKEPLIVSPVKDKKAATLTDKVKEELKTLQLLGKREKLSRDDMVNMILAGEESLRMMIRKPSHDLIEFIKAHLDNEDDILLAIPKFDMPKADFERQVLREMRIVLRENMDIIKDK